MDRMPIAEGIVPYAIFHYPGVTSTHISKCSNLWIVSISLDYVCSVAQCTPRKIEWFCEFCVSKQQLETVEHECRNL